MTASAGPCSAYTPVTCMTWVLPPEYYQLFSGSISPDPPLLTKSHPIVYSAAQISRIWVSTSFIIRELWEEPHPEERKYCVGNRQEEELTTCKSQSR